MENEKIYKYALESYYKLKSIVENFNGTFEELCDKLSGHNFEDDLFDVYFELICGTVLLRNNMFKLADNIDIWNDNCEYVGTFDIEYLEKHI